MALIDKDSPLHNLALISELQKRDSRFLNGIVEVYEAVQPLLNNRIPTVFKKYTLHDTGHSFRIMKYMADLAKDLSSLNELEVVLLIYAALLHDIGMAVCEKDIQAIKNDNFKHSDIKFSTMKRVLNDSEDEALQEYVRRIHGKLSAIYILENHKHQFTVPTLTTLSFSKELALICESHVENIDWITRNLTNYEVRGDFFFNPQYVAALLRLADILDIDTNRTPYKLYKSIAPLGLSGEEWKQHFIISNNSKIELDETTQQKKDRISWKSFKSLYP